jgi:hypothetical protein
MRVLFDPRQISEAFKRPVTPFDPEGSEYDYRTAQDAGLKPDADGHWSSRDPRSGMLLKGRGHPTFDKGVEADRALGYELEKRGGRYYTLKGGRP